jgi:hypothetical protein
VRRQAADAAEDPEAGMVLVFMIVFIVVAIGLAALTIDLATMRQTRATNRSAADMAAVSGALVLSETNMTNMVAACEASWSYALDNLSLPASPHDCSPFAGSCDATTERTATGIAGTYTITITNPVNNLAPDTIGNQPQAGDAAVDGNPCERIAVQITEHRPYAFASALGFHTAVTTSRSVARALIGSKAGELAALLLLDPTHCNALTSSGQGTIEVQGAGTSAGIIAVDSSGTATGGNNGCGNNRYTLDASNNTNSRILADPGSGGAPGKIEEWALAPGQGNAHAYDSGQVPTNVSPMPVASPKQFGRQVVDNEYNCATGTTDCDAGPYINTLVSNYGTGTPAGFTTISGSACSPSTNTSYAGNTLVSCPSGFTVQNVTVTFTGGDVIFAGGVNVQGGTLNVNPSGSADHIVFIRSGGLSTGAAGTLNMPHTFVYIANGTINLLATGPVTWNAPVAGNFHGLSLWSESSAQHELKGQATLDLGGVFFTPNAHVQFDGQGSQVQVQAQFVAATLDMNGQGTLRMMPDPNSVVRLPTFGSTLIR